MSYRERCCEHCGGRPGTAPCRDCDVLLCGPCAIDRRCPGCVRTGLSLRRSRLRAGALVAMIAAGGLAGVALIERALEGHDDDRQPEVRAQLRLVEQSLARYTVDLGECPESLGSLHTRGYLGQRDLHDPWGHTLGYQCVGDARSRVVRLWSAGPDGIDRTADDLEVESNWTLAGNIARSPGPSRAPRAGHRRPWRGESR